MEKKITHKSRTSVTQYSSYMTFQRGMIAILNFSIKIHMQKIFFKTANTLHIHKYWKIKGWARPEVSWVEEWLAQRPHPTEPFRPL